MEEAKKAIEDVLKKENQDIELEAIPNEETSPLAQAVVQKNNSSPDMKGTAKNPAPTSEQSNTTDTSNTTRTEPLENDAPEQPIEEQEAAPEARHENKEANQEPPISKEYAGLIADSIIGTINNTVLEIGCGYFVTIRKHRDFFEFDELIQVIDEQNTRNIKRLKLDEEDKALLRPLLVQILQKKAVQISPEKQLLMVALSILIKKAKLVMEIRAENELLVERIRGIIRQEVNKRDEGPVANAQTDSAQTDEDNDNADKEDTTDTAE